MKKKGKGGKKKDPPLLIFMDPLIKLITFYYLLPLFRPFYSISPFFFSLSFFPSFPPFLPSLFFFLFT